MTLISAIIVAGVAACVLFVLSKIAPLYTEFARTMKVVRTVSASHLGKDPYTVREAVLKELQNANVKNVAPRNIKVLRGHGGNGIRFEINYEAPVHLFGHLGVIAKFNRTVEPEGSNDGAK